MGRVARVFEGDALKRPGVRNLENENLGLERLQLIEIPQNSKGGREVGFASAARPR
jgi:hypothetical protein